MSHRTREKNSESNDGHIEEKIEWTAEEEIQLFFALEGLRPFGINKFFYMACISDRLSKALNREISTDIIWTHLNSMYNLKVLDQLEKLPFPNKVEDFALPENEFNALMTKKKNEIEAEQQKKGVGSSTSGGGGASSSSGTTTSNNTEIVKKDLDNVNKISKTPAQPINPKISNLISSQTIGKDKDNSIDKKIAAKIISMAETPKRPPKRTRGSMSLESNNQSPSTTPPPIQKRRRI